MNLHEFESLAKERFSNASETIDVEHLLVDLNLENRNMLPTHWTKVLIFLGLVSALGLLLYFNMNDTFSSVKTPVISKHHMVNQDQPTSGETKHENIEVIAHEADSNPEGKKLLLAADQDDDHKFESQKKEQSMTRKIELSSKYTSNQSNSEKTSPAISSTSDIDNNHNSMISVNSTFESTNNRNENIGLNDRVVFQSVKNNQFYQETFKGHAAQENLKDQALGNAEIKLIPSLDLLNNLPIETLEPLAHSAILGGRQPQNCPDFGGKKWFMAVVPEIGYEHNMKQLGTDAEELSDLVDLRNENEQVLEGYQFGLYLMGQHTSGLYVKGGVTYSKFTERLRLNRTYTEMDTTIGIVSVTKSQNCDTLTTIYGDIITTTEVSENRSIHYSFSSIDIPVAVGYGINLGRLNLDLEGGAILNIKNKAKGKLFTEINDFESLDNTNRFKRTLGVGFFASALVRRELRNGSAVYLGPRYEFRPTQYSTEYNPVDQKYSAVGLYAGYMHRF